MPEESARKAYVETILEARYPILENAGKELATCPLRSFVVIRTADFEATGLRWIVEMYWPPRLLPTTLIASSEDALRHIMNDELCGGALAMQIEGELELRPDATAAELQELAGELLKVQTVSELNIEFVRQNVAALFAAAEAAKLHATNGHTSVAELLPEGRRAVMFRVRFAPGDHANCREVRSTLRKHIRHELGMRTIENITLGTSSTIWSQISD